MNIYARIRKIEDDRTFKRLFNTIMGAVYQSDFEPTKDWHDFGVDGYLKSNKTVYAVYCPNYPERRSQIQYTDKILSDIMKLDNALEKGKINLEVKEWFFVTPDDLSVKVKNFIKQKAEEKGWRWGSLTAQSLAPMFMEHKEINMDFPEITAGMQFDKVPSLYIKHVNNRGHSSLEIFNNGTEAIQDLRVQIGNNNEWQEKNDFVYDFESPSMVSWHTCFTLKQGERQFLMNVHKYGDYYYNISGVGVESGKTFNIEGYIEKNNTS